MRPDETDPRGPLRSSAPAFVAGFLSVAVATLLVGAGHAVVTRSVPDAEAALTTGPGPAGAPGVQREVDRNSLGGALRASGVSLPPGANVYAAVVQKHPDGVRFEAYEAGGGSLAADFWPASSVKPLAAVGALEFLAGQGFTGAATVTFAGGESRTVRDLYKTAIAVSSNDAYDRLVEITGVDWLNTVFLTPANGFPESVIQKSYVDVGGVSSPPMTIQEAGRVLDLPARVPAGDYGVPDDGNRSTLLELTESVGRVILDADLPDDNRFDVDPTDLLALRQALLEADGFMRAGAVASLGPGALVYDKPGYVVGDDCVDVGVVERPDRSQSFLLGVSMPDDGQSCATLAGIAENTLDFLNALD